MSALRRWAVWSRAGVEAFRLNIVIALADSWASSRVLTALHGLWRTMKNGGSLAWLVSDCRTVISRARDAFLARPLRVVGVMGSWALLVNAALLRLGQTPIGPRAGMHRLLAMGMCFWALWSPSASQETWASSVIGRWWNRGVRDVRDLR